MGRTTVLSALALAVVSIGACARNDNDGTDVSPERGGQSARNDSVTTNSAGQDAIMDSARIGSRSDSMRTSTSAPQGSSSTSSTTTSDPQGGWSSGSTTSGGTGTTGSTGTGSTGTTGTTGTTSGNPQGTTSSGATTSGGSTSVPQGKGDAREVAEQGKALDDAAIMGLMDAADRADSASGALAVSRSTNADVQAYGRKMMIDHHQMREHGQQVAKQANITPKAPADHPIVRMAEQGTQQLQRAERGEAFDRLYAANEVKMHRQVLETAKQGKTTAKSEAVRQHLTAGEPTLQEHLRQAEELEKKVGGRPQQAAGSQQPS
jgi:predicted outer membrane protein